MPRQKRTLKGWLKKELKKTDFKKAYEEEDIKARIALLITERRNKLGLTQAQLARKIHSKQQTISDIESLRHPNITLNTLQKIAGALNSHLHIYLQ